MEIDREKLSGCLWGCAVGDSLGLPFENLSSRRIAKLLKKRKLDHRFVLKRGMVSDDTDHSLIVARSILRHPQDSLSFQKLMASDLKRWVLAVPPGIGLGTLRSLLKLVVGVSPPKSGVYSAGNGPAMRSAVIGCLLSDNRSLRIEYTEKSSQITHSDPKATIGALAISEIAACLANGQWKDKPSLSELENTLSAISSDQEWAQIVAKISDTLMSGQTLAEMVSSQGAKRGVSGYVYHTVPFAIVCWYRHFGDFEATVEHCIRAGGDTDTTAAICGALAGITASLDSIPERWREGILLWPFRKEQLDGFEISTPPVWQMALRNLFSLSVILVHCGRRCLPPY
ncbi:MAG: ADP-ribosylglycohydrolase family protein [Verrucomicrobiales bacterium]|nr:ADP-ribosylglycohydrolase family protein [Verrucomicrobiales bacterium]